MPANTRNRSFLERIVPRVPHRFLLLAAGLAWTIAGAMLLGRAVLWLDRFGDHLVARYSLAFACGLAFFFGIFSRISRKHVARIHRIEHARPSLFSFFDRRAYLMMAFMIAGGIVLRTSGLIPPEILYTFYACMGTPLLISAFRFYRSFARASEAPAK